MNITVLKSKLPLYMYRVCTQQQISINEINVPIAKDFKLHSVNMNDALLPGSMFVRDLG